MTVPFFEYCTGDGNSLGATTIQATIPNLNSRMTYTVTALVRAYGPVFLSPDELLDNGFKKDQLFHIIPHK